MTRNFLDIQISAITTGNMFENILLDYARLQIELKNEPAFEYYCKLAGGRGKKLLEDYQAKQVVNGESSNGN